MKSMMQIAKFFAPAVTALIACTAHAQLGDMLIYSAGDDRFYHEITAADNLGRTYDHIVDDIPALNIALRAEAYELAVIHNPASTFPPEIVDAIVEFINEYRRIHLSYWNLDAEPSLQDALGIAAATDFFVPREIYDSAGHPSWGDAPSPLIPAVEPSPWNDNGDQLIPNGDPIAAFDSIAGPVASVTHNNQRSIVNGFDYDSMDAAGIVALLENQIDWVEDSLGGPPTGSYTLLFEADNERHLAHAFDRVGISTDFIVTHDIRALTIVLFESAIQAAFISNPCCYFDRRTPDLLARAIDRGTIVHLSYWAIDADPILQDAFGIASSADFSLPRAVFNNTGHPSWGDALSLVPPSADPSPWDINGAELAPAPDAEIVGVFEGTAGQGAVVAANAGHEQYRTIFNGFVYDAMEDDAVEQLLAAQALWLLGRDAVCFADFDRDGSLTIFDFLGFQNAFDMGDLRADCDGDGLLTLFDFLCFQNGFDTGCP